MLDGVEMQPGNDPVGAFLDYAPPDAPAEPGSGALGGLRLAVKDLFDVAGHPTGGGHPLRRQLEPVRSVNAPSVQRLLDEGAIFVGKTHTDEFAYAMNGENPHYGTPINPRAPGRVPGGSSSGSAAAVAAGLADIALGTDTGGSIRLPASYCGLAGLRTTHGAIDISGVQPLARSFDTVGWFARDPVVYRKVAELLLPPGEAEPIRKLKIATDILAFAGETERGVFERAIAQFAIPVTGTIVAAPDGFELRRHVFRTIQAYEAWADHGDWIVRHEPALGDGVRERFEWASRVSREDYDAARREKAHVEAAMRQLIPPGTGIVFPTAPSVALPLGVTGTALETYRQRAISMLCSAGLSGLPQISMPLATVDGLPFGISIMGAKQSDFALLQCWDAIERGI
jgi:amidase